MTEDDIVTEETKKCPNSKLETYLCNCSNCQVFSINAVQLIAGQGIRDVSDRIDRMRDLFDYLIESGFDIEFDQIEGEIKLIPPAANGEQFWMRCPGCFIPFLLTPTDDPLGMCDSCAEKSASQGSNRKKYYNDLFEYISVMFELGRELTEELGYTREFCRLHGFDYKAVKARLNATGGYDEGEVMMNSAIFIPMFERMPLTKEEMNTDD